MSKFYLQSYEKLDHTFCMNFNEKRIKFAIDDCDCKDINDMIDCLEDMRNVSKAFDIIKKCSVNIVLLKGCRTHKEYNEFVDSYNTLTRKAFNLIKRLLEE